jgi:hypothetical protein
VSGGEMRDGVSLTNLDQPLFGGAEATKRDLVDYLDAVADRIIAELRGRPLSVVRVLRGQAPFMQKNVPKYTPSWVRTVTLWAESSRREVSYALCDDRRTLLSSDSITNGLAISTISACDDLLYDFKAARWAARVADAASSPALPLRRARQPVSWRENLSLPGRHDPEAFIAS